jgi:predicted class III extradiol MEMO1 family dioxygenase
MQDIPTQGPLLPLPIGILIPHKCNYLHLLPFTILRILILIIIVIHRKTVLLLGPMHCAYVQNACQITKAKICETPIGNIDIDVECKYEIH